jgi:hypothetical protein
MLLLALLPFFASLMFLVHLFTVAVVPAITVVTAGAGIPE